MVKNIIVNCGLHPENIHRLVRKNGDPTTFILYIYFFFWFYLN